MNHSAPLVSIIMPAYNSGIYISDSILSVLNQDYQNWELLIVDDGSTDHTRDIVNSYLSKDERIKYLYQENAGAAQARNNALQKAEGSLIAFLDSDDLWLPEKLSVSVKEFASSEQDLLFTGAYVFHEVEDIGRIPELDRIIVEDAVYKGTDGISKFMEFNRIPILTVLARREIIVEAGGFSSIKIAEDYYLWLKLLLNNYVFKSIDKNLSAYRLRKDSQMGGVVNESLEVLNMFTLLSQEYPQIRTDYKQEIRHWFTRYVKDYLNRENIADLKKYLIYFGFYSNRIKMIYSLRKLLTFSLFRSLIKSAL